MNMREIINLLENSDPLDEAPVADVMRARRFYHGTKYESAAQGILRNGIVPGSLTQQRGNLAPVAGKVYITPDIRYATIYALGGVMMGHKIDSYIIHENRYGYVFVIDGNDLVDVQPDEDSVGEWFNNCVLRQYDETTRPWKLLGYRHHTGKIIKSLDERLYAGSNDPMEWQVFCFVWNNMTANQRKGSLDGMVAAQAAGGKRALKTMPDDMKQWLMTNVKVHIAHTGAIIPIECWRIDKKLSPRIADDASNFFELAQRIR